MRIDAHQHFWKFNPVRDTWITPEMAVLRRDFLPTDLEPHLLRHKIDGCVAVQADQSETETNFLLDVAARHPFIRKVVGWVDLAAPDIEGRLATLRPQPRLAGFRHILQSEPPEKLADPSFRNGISKLEEYGYTYDILIYPKHLRAAMDLTDAFPNQPFVLDHLAKPPIRHKQIEPWRKQLKELARRDHVCCKLSGMVTEAATNAWKQEDLFPYVEIALEAFGPHRLMFGSDWPVCLLAGTYDKVISVVDTFVNALSPTERQHIMGATAARFYGIAN